MRPSSLLAPLLALAALACASTEVDWERVEEARFVSEDGSFTLELPLGWARSEHALTREGWERQTITFNAGAVLEPTEGLPIDASAPELLEVMREQLAGQPGIELVECRAARLDGLAAFRMHFRRSAEEDAPPSPAQAVLYGAVDGVTLYAFSLESGDAASFAQDLEAFELMVASFHRVGGASPPR
jgi:hypothetical protein